MIFKTARRRRAQARGRAVRFHPAAFFGVPL
jgi:hypothetical protein